MDPSITIRTGLRPGDLGEVVRLHGVLYAREYGFDHTFEAYVAGPLAEFAGGPTTRQRIWLAERAGRLVGSIAIATATPTVAQLRWFLVEPEARGIGLGRRLLSEAIAFSRAAGYETIMLWTVSTLEVATHLYRAAGFRKVEAVQGTRWGVDLIEERYELTLE